MLIESINLCVRFWGLAVIQCVDALTLAQVIGLTLLVDFLPLLTGTGSGFSEVDAILVLSLPPIMMLELTE